VTDDQDPGDVAEPQQDEPIFRSRRVGIGDQEREFVEEHRPGLLEGNTVLAPILLVLSFVPLETEVGQPDQRIT